ncbi:MAG: SIS domain-containing protein [Actinomycetota bacterium]|nr:SIS domain-containing protein [Actinomycetota bacterium]
MTAPGSQLEREIREQPTVLAALLQEPNTAISEVATFLRRRPPRYVVIAARGSSDNAARYAQYLFGERLKLPVALAAPSLESLYAAGAVPRDGEGLVIGISQSGRSPDIVSVLTAAREAGAPTLAVTNDTDSPLARAAELVIGIGTGPERAVAATKTYTASLAALAALVTQLRDDGPDGAALRSVPAFVERAIDDAFVAVEALDRHADAKYVLSVARGYNFATAMEIALKLRELTGAVAEGFSAADLLHGPIAATPPGTPVIVVAPDGLARNSVLETARTLHLRGAEPLEIASTPDAALALPSQVPEWLSPIVAVVCGQVLALRWAVVQGRPLDAPRGLQKVTETY